MTGRSSATGAATGCPPLSRKRRSVSAPPAGREMPTCRPFSAAGAGPRWTQSRQYRCGRQPGRRRRVPLRHGCAVPPAVPRAWTSTRTSAMSAGRIFTSRSRRQLPLNRTCPRRRGQRPRRSPHLNRTYLLRQRLPPRPSLRGNTAPPAVLRSRMKNRTTAMSAGTAGGPPLPQPSRQIFCLSLKKQRLLPRPLPVPVTAGSPLEGRSAACPS